MSALDTLIARLSDALTEVAPEVAFLYGRKAVTAPEGTATAGAQLIVDPIALRQPTDSATATADLLVFFGRPLQPADESTGNQADDEQAVTGEMETMARAWLAALDIEGQMEVGDATIRPLAALTPAQLYGVSVTAQVTAAGLYNPCIRVSYPPRP